MRVILKFQTNTIQSEIQIEVHKSIILGRSSLSNHIIDDPLMSGAHCKISVSPSKLEITDLESKNGTYLNGLRIEHSEVFLGDEIKMGGTKITILGEKMDPASVDMLTFPGALRDRQSHGLKLDFAGARLLNQGPGNPDRPETRPTSSSNKELEVRKKIKSNIKLSKHEIRIRNKSRASLASTLDVLLGLFSVAGPLFMTNLLILIIPAFIQQNRLPVMFASVVACFTLFFILNFKILKFTLGEKLAGIQKLHNQQEH